MTDDHDRYAHVDKRTTLDLQDAADVYILQDTQLATRGEKIVQLSFLCGSKRRKMLEMRNIMSVTKASAPAPTHLHLCCIKIRMPRTHSEHRDS
jgi:hypothetical protein